MAAAFVWMNGVLLVAALVGWPLTQFTVARHEPAFVLGLSWMAIILACWGNLLTATVKRDTTGD
jgi:hypothetical protein